MLTIIQGKFKEGFAFVIKTHTFECLSRDKRSVQFVMRILSPVSDDMSHPRVQMASYMA